MCLKSLWPTRKKIANKLCDFLELPFSQLPLDALKTHANQSAVPKNFKLQLLKNKFFRSRGNRAYQSKLPFHTSIAQTEQSGLIEEALVRLHGKLNPVKIGSAPKIKPATKKFLDRLFQLELEGLSKLVKKDLDHLWFGAQQDDKNSDTK